MRSYRMLQESAAYIKNKIDEVPDLAMILGTGLSNILSDWEIIAEIPYGDIPHFPRSTVKGHLGRLLYGKIGDRPVIVLSGRVHYYEGYSMEECGYATEVMGVLGVKTMIVTCAVGAINREITPPDLVVLCDHIKLCADSPLRGLNIDEIGVRYPDMTNAYTPDLIELAKQIAYSLGISMQEAVYGYMSGPQFETPAEIRALEVMGADVVGMSVVPEVIIAAHSGIRVLGIGWASNMAAGIQMEGISLKEQATDDFSRLMKVLVNEL